MLTIDSTIQRLFRYNDQVDGLIGGFSMIGASPFLAMALATADINSYLFYIFIFISEVKFIFCVRIPIKISFGKHR